METQNPHDPSPDKLGDDPHPDDAPKASGESPKRGDERDPTKNKEI
jgi:hypothetical protein